MNVNNFSNNGEFQIRLNKRKLTMAFLACVFSSQFFSFFLGLYYCFVTYNKSKIILKNIFTLIGWTIPLLICLLITILSYISFMKKIYEICIVENKEYYFYIKTSKDSKFNLRIDNNKFNQIIYIIVDIIGIVLGNLLLYFSIDIINFMSSYRYTPREVVAYKVSFLNVIIPMLLTVICILNSKCVKLKVIKKYLKKETIFNDKKYNKNSKLKKILKKYFGQEGVLAYNSHKSNSLKFSIFRFRMIIGMVICFGVIFISNTMLENVRLKGMTGEELRSNVIVYSVMEYLVIIVILKKIIMSILKTIILINALIHENYYNIQNTSECSNIDKKKVYVIEYLIMGLKEWCISAGIALFGMITSCIISMLTVGRVYVCTALFVFLAVSLTIIIIYTVYLGKYIYKRVTNCD